MSCFPTISISHLTSFSHAHANSPLVNESHGSTPTDSAGEEEHSLTDDIASVVISSNAASSRFTGTRTVGVNTSVRAWTSFVNEDGQLTEEERVIHFLSLSVLLFFSLVQPP